MRTFSCFLVLIENFFTPGVARPSKIFVSNTIFIISSFFIRGCIVCTGLHCTTQKTKLGEYLPLFRVSNFFSNNSCVHGYNFCWFCMLTLLQKLTVTWQMDSYCYSKILWPFLFLWHLSAPLSLSYFAQQGEHEQAHIILNAHSFQQLWIYGIVRSRTYFDSVLLCLVLRLSPGIG